LLLLVIAISACAACGRSHLVGLAMYRRQGRIGKFGVRHQRVAVVFVIVELRMCFQIMLLLLLLLMMMMIVVVAVRAAVRHQRWTRLAHLEGAVIVVARLI
jgi:hypothetical protein